MINKIFCSLIFFALVIAIKSGAQESRTTNFPKTEEKPSAIPDKEDLWVFLLAGQSNMAGRGLVEPIDTIPDPRILSINKSGDLILAKEPLHFYEPGLTGLDCGLSFGKELLKHIPRSISILILPTAVGGSSIAQWLGDSTYRNVTLLTNFSEKVKIGNTYGQIKGILWHQGETDSSKPETLEIYDRQLQKLISIFRTEVNNPNLPIFIGALGAFSQSPENWLAINEKIKDYLKTDSSAFLIETGDLLDKGDRIHFDSEGQRTMGTRFAQEVMKNSKK
jgi:hypothetical protein